MGARRAGYPSVPPQRAAGFCPGSAVALCQMDRSERLTGNADTALERCRVCPSKLMQPVQWRRLGEDLWEIDLRCPDCGGAARECVPQEAVARYDQVMRRARLSLERHLEAIERVDPTAEHAPYGDPAPDLRILPEDLGPGAEAA